MRTLLLLLATASAALAQTNVLFIFDASGSMKARAGGETRIAAAKRAMSAALREMPGGVRLGLMMYGHRKAKDCTDIELVSPIGADDGAAIDEVVQKVQPRGETPIAAALQKAAKSFAAFKGQQNTIVLVTDGIEECRGDPCATARALKDAGLDLKVHIVGYMLNDTQRAAIRCVTDTTGGRFFDAGDPTALTTALKDVRKVVEAPAPPPVREPLTVAATPEPPPAPKADLGIKCVAVYAKGGKEYEGTVTWTVLEEKANLAGERRRVAEAYNAPNGHVFKDLAPGKYVLRASVAYHLAREFPLEVKGGDAVRNEYVMDMAQVRFDARLAKGGPAYDGGVSWQVLDPKTNLAGERAKRAELYNVKSGIVALIPAGEHVLHAYLNGFAYVRTEMPLKVVAGEDQTVDAVLGAALVRLDARLAAGQPPVDAGLAWQVLSPKPKLDGTREKIAEFYDVPSGRVVPLPAGEWTVRVYLRGNDAVDVEKPIVVKAGEEQVFDVELGAGTVVVEVVEKGQPFGASVTWTIHKGDKKVAEHYNGAARAIRFLPAGTYRVEYASYANAARKGSADVTVKPGETVVVKADLASAK